MALSSNERYYFSEQQALNVLARSQTFLVGSGLQTLIGAAQPDRWQASQAAAGGGGALFGGSGAQGFFELHQAKTASEQVGSDELALWLQQHVPLAEGMDVHELLNKAGMATLPHELQLEPETYRLMVCDSMQAARRQKWSFLYMELTTLAMRPEWLPVEAMLGGSANDGEDGQDLGLSSGDPLALSVSQGT